MSSCTTIIHRRVVSPILGIKARDFVTIPRDAIIQTPPHADEPGLRPIVFGDQELLAFTRDIEERSERIDGSTASSLVI